MTTLASSTARVHALAGFAGAVIPLLFLALCGRELTRTHWASATQDLGLALAFAQLAWRPELLLCWNYPFHEIPGRLRLMDRQKLHPLLVAIPLGGLVLIVAGLIAKTAGVP